jgi:hypothetical protein
MRFFTNHGEKGGPAGAPFFVHRSDPQGRPAGLPSHGAGGLVMENNGISPLFPVCSRQPLRPAHPTLIHLQQYLPPAAHS